MNGFINKWRRSKCIKDMIKIRIGHSSQVIIGKFPVVQDANLRAKHRLRSRDAYYCYDSLQNQEQGKHRGRVAELGRKDEAKR